MDRAAVYGTVSYKGPNPLRSVREICPYLSHVKRNCEVSVDEECQSERTKIEQTPFSEKKLNILTSRNV